LSTIDNNVPLLLDEDYDIKKEKGSTLPQKMLQGISKILWDLVVE
jgi:hypothetical protein